MTLSTTAASALEILENIGVESPDVSIHLHSVAPRDASTIVAHFPDWRWIAHGGSGTQWVEGVRDGARMIIFLKVPRSTERPSEAQLVLEAAKGIQA